MLVWAIVSRSGGATGTPSIPRAVWARIIHAILPISKKAANGWSYATVPVIGPLVCGAVAGLLARVVGF